MTPNNEKRPYSDQQWAKWVARDWKMEPEPRSLEELKINRRNGGSVLRWKIGKQLAYI